MSKPRRTSNQDPPRNSHHKDTAMKTLKAQINQLQKQVKEIKMNKKLHTQASSDKENVSNKLLNVCRCNMNVPYGHKVHLMDLSSKERFFDVRKVNECVDVLQKSLQNSNNSLNIGSHLNNLLTVIEYEFQLLEGVINEKQFKNQELERIAEDVKYQLFEIEKQKQTQIYNVSELGKTVSEQDQVLAQQLVKLTDYQTIISSYKNQNLQLVHEVKQAEKVIQELNKQVQMVQNKKKYEFMNHIDLEQRIDEQMKEQAKLQRQNQYYRDYIEEIFTNIKKMEHELVFCRKELIKWKELCFRNDE